MPYPYCLSLGILLHSKILSMKHAYTTKTVLFLTCKRHYNNDVSCYQDSTFASNAHWRQPLFFFSEWLIRPSWKTKDFINRCCINFVLPIMQLKHVFDPSLVCNEQHSRNPIKIHQLLFSKLSHIKPSFQQIFYNKAICSNKNHFFIYPC